MSECGCKIEGRGTALEYTHDEIVFCPLHLSAQQTALELQKIKQELAQATSAAGEMLEALKELHSDSMASDFNEHWDSFTKANAVIKRASGETAKEGK